VGVGVGEMFQAVDPLDGFDRQPPDARRPGALAGLEARGGPSTDGGSLAPVTEGVEEDFFEEELAHGCRKTSSISTKDRGR
jgi:hypothetical protein